MAHLKKLKQLKRPQSGASTSSNRSEVSEIVLSGDKNIPKNDIEIDPAIFVAIEYQKNLDELRWTLDSEDPELRFKIFIDDLVKRGKQIKSQQNDDDHVSGGSDDEWETLAEKTFAIGDGENPEQQQEEAEESDEPKPSTSRGEPGTSSEDSDSSKKRNRQSKHRETDYFEREINQAFNNLKLMRKIEWPDKMKDHPILSKYDEPTIYEADLLQTILDIKDRQEKNKQRHKQDVVDVLDYHKNMARVYPDSESRPKEVVQRRNKNTVAARKSRAKNKICEKELKRESAEKFKKIHEKFIAFSKMSLYCNELRKMVNLPVVADLTEEMILKVDKWNVKNS